MNTHKAAYWLALAVLGFALHSEYRQGAFPTLHRAVTCAGATFCRMATHARQAVIIARMLTGRPALPTDDALASADAIEMVEDRAEWLREQAEREAELHRGQVHDRAELLRDQARAQAEMIRTQVLLQRDQIQQIHRCVRSQLRASNAVNRHIVVMCPRTRARVAVDTAKGLSDLDTNLPGVEVVNSF